MEVIGTIKGVRDLLEHSRAKDIIAENPDYASNPEIIDQIGAVNPDLGNQLRGTLPKALELREQRAAAGALWAKRALGAGMKAYQGALNASEEGGPVTEANFAEADKAAQDMYGRFRRVMKDKGFNVDSLLPPVWSLRDQDRLEAEYGAITDAMRTPYNVVKPDGSAETMYFLPGEDAQFAAEMKRGGQPVKVEKLGTALGVKTAAEKGLDANQVADAVRQWTGDFQKVSQPWLAIREAADKLNIAAAEGTGTADVAAFSLIQRMIDGGVVQEGEAQRQMNTAGIAGTIDQMIARAKGGRYLTPEQMTKVTSLANNWLKSGERQQAERVERFRGPLKQTGLGDPAIEAILGSVPMKGLEAPEVKATTGLSTKPRSADELGALLATVRDPKAPLPSFKAALSKLPEGELPMVNPEKLPEAQLDAYIAEMAARKERAKSKAKKGGK